MRNDDVNACLIFSQVFNDLQEHFYNSTGSSTILTDNQIKNHQQRIWTWKKNIESKHPKDHAQQVKELEPIVKLNVQGFTNFPQMFNEFKDSVKHDACSLEDKVSHITRVWKMSLC